MIDASSSMMARFPGGAPERERAERGDLLHDRRRRRSVHPPADEPASTTTSSALIEFGDEAYVVTPFTTDYDNILLSLSLIGDWTEFMKFPDQGTTIGAAIEQGIGLFKAFDFLDAAGNLMVLFSDGQDTQVTIHGKTVPEIVAGAVQAKIPVYMIRTSYNKALGGVLPDDIWKPAIEATGGKFYRGVRRGDDPQRDQGHRSPVGRTRGHQALQQPSGRSSRRYAFMAASLLDRRAAAAADGAVFPEVSVECTEA